MTQGNNNVRFGRPGNVQGFAPGILPGIKPQDLKPGRCNAPDCNNHLFIPIFQVGMASPLQTQNAQPMIVQFPSGFACMKCGKLNPFEEIEKKKEKLEDPTHSDLSVDVGDGIKTEEKLK